MRIVNGIYKGYPEALAGKLVRDFYKAMESNDLDRVREMLDNGFPIFGDLNITLEDSAIKVAVLANMTDVLRVFKKYMIDWGMSESDANLTIRYDDDRIMILYAAQSARVYEGSALQFMLEECGAEANVQTSEMHNPIHLAARHGGVGAIEPLMQHGCDINGVNVMGRTPLGEALIHEHTDAATELLRLGCKTSIGTARLVTLPQNSQAFMKAYEAREKLHKNVKAIAGKKALGEALK